MKSLTTTPRLPFGVGARILSYNKSVKTTVSRGLRCLLLTALVVIGFSCRKVTQPTSPSQLHIEPFGFQISSGADHYQIEGYFGHSDEAVRMPALLVLNGDGGDALRCIHHVRRFTALHIRLACISLPGYGKSSGPSRFVCPQSVEA